MEDKRMNEIEEIEATEVDETQDSSNAGALLAGVIGGFIAYAVIGGAKKLRVIIEEKVAAKKLRPLLMMDGMLVLCAMLMASILFLPCCLSL